MEAHYISMVVIGIGSFAFGVLPMVFCFRIRRTYPFFLSMILCLGAGVLLATSLVHMLTEVQERLKTYAQLYFCAGLLCLYTFDEISHYCIGIKKLEIQSVHNEDQRSNYGSTEPSVSSCESSPFLKPIQHKVSRASNEFFCNDKQFECSHMLCKGKSEMQQNPGGNCSHSEINNHDQTVCHLVEEERLPPNSAAKTGLLISLLIHSILEGVSIGVQTKISQILLILGAVTFHKIVLSFCLGLELHHFGYTKWQLLIALFLFSIGSPLGILLGVSVTSLENGIFNMDAQLQAIAAGSLLYVALLEVLPRERSKWRSAKRTGGIFQLIFLLIGFACITLFHFFIDLKSDGNDNHIKNITQRFS